MKYYHAYCKVPLYFEAENDEDAYAFVDEYFNSGLISSDDIYEVELYSHEEE